MNRTTAATATPKTYDARCVDAENCGRKNMSAIVEKNTIALVDFHHAELNEGVLIPPIANKILENPITGLMAKQYEIEPRTNPTGSSQCAGFVFGLKTDHTAIILTIRWNTLAW